MRTNIKSETSFKRRNRSQSPRGFVKDGLLRTKRLYGQFNNKSQEQEYAQMCDRQRNSHNALVNHMEEERGRPLNAEEKDILLYLAYPSCVIARTTLVDEYMGKKEYYKYGDNINVFYINLKNDNKLLQKDTFDACKKYFAEQSYNFFTDKGWLTPDSNVMDLFSGIDASFAKCAKNKQKAHSDPMLKKLKDLKENGQEDTDDYKSTKEKYTKALYSKITASDGMYSLLDDNQKDLSVGKNPGFALDGTNMFLEKVPENHNPKADFIHMSAPAIPCQKDDHNKIDDNQYNMFTANLLALSKNGTHIAMGFHINSCQLELLDAFKEKLKNDPRFDYESITPSPEDNHLLADSFVDIIHLKVKDLTDSKMPARTDSKMPAQRRKKQQDKPFSGFKKGFLTKK